MERLRDMCVRVCMYHVECTLGLCWIHENIA